MRTTFYGWQLIAVLWFIMACAIGFSSYGGNVINTYMVTEMGLDRKSLGLANGSFGLCMGLFSPLT